MDRNKATTLIHAPYRSLYMRSYKTKATVWTKLGSTLGALYLNSLKRTHGRRGGTGKKRMKKSKKQYRKRSYKKWLQTWDEDDYIAYRQTSRNRKRTVRKAPRRFVESIW